MHWFSWTCNIIEFLRLPKIFDAIRGEMLFNIVWHILSKVEPLTPIEVEAARQVFGPSAIKYDAVRVASGRVLSIVFKLNGGRAFVTLHTINFPSSGKKSRSNLELVIHELTHVYQYELVGSIYIIQALRAQKQKNGRIYYGYEYGEFQKEWETLKQYHKNGWKLRFYNREQQAMIAQDYYSKVVVKKLPDDNQISKAYAPFIKQLKEGDL